MKILTTKSHRLYKNEKGGKIMVRLSLPEGEEGSLISCLYQKMREKYFSVSKRFIEEKNDTHTYFLDVTVEGVDGEEVKIKRSSALKCGASLIKETTVFDIFDKDMQKLKKR